MNHNHSRHRHPRHRHPRHLQHLKDCGRPNLPAAMSGFDASSSGAEPTRGGGGNAQDGDESHCSSHPDSVDSVSLPSHAATDASAIRGDISSREAATGEVYMKPNSWNTQATVVWDGDVDTPASVDPDRDCGCPGQFGVLCGNWGDRAQKSVLSKRMHFDLKTGPCSVVMLQEAAASVLEHMRAPEEEKDSTATETRGGGATKSDERRTAQYFGIRGNEQGTSVMIAARKSHVKHMRMRLFRLRHDGEYRAKRRSGSNKKRKDRTQHMACSRILVVTCKMRYFRLLPESDGLHGGGEEQEPIDEISFMTCHLHHNTAKKELVSGKAIAYAGFWDEVAAAINEFEVRVLSGDFNMALWKVAVELRARGVAAHIAAWYAHTQPNEDVPRIDSTAIFLIGRCAGIRKAFDVGLICKAAVATEPVPDLWKNVEEIIRDETGKIVKRRPYGSVKKDYGKKRLCAIELPSERRTSNDPVPKMELRDF